MYLELRSFDWLDWLIGEWSFDSCMDKCELAEIASKYSLSSFCCAGLWTFTPMPITK